MPLLRRPRRPPAERGEARGARARPGLLVLLLLAALLLGGAAGRVLLPGPATARVVRGTAVHVSPDRTQLGFRPDGHCDPDGPPPLRERLVDLRYGGRNAVTAYQIADVPWADAKGAWHAGSPPACLVTPATVGQRVELGLVQVRPGAGEAPGGPVVAWLRCLG
jgi:hypothetical protein